jgi:hypothetical protein
VKFLLFGAITVNVVASLYLTLIAPIMITGWNNTTFHADAAVVVASADRSESAGRSWASSGAMRGRARRFGSRAARRRGACRMRVDGARLNDAVSRTPMSASRCS